MAAAGKPYLVSFVVRREGMLLDATPLKEAIAAIDATVSPRPLAYLVNCTHASIFRAALLHEVNSSPLVRERVAGLLANTAALEPEELDNSAGLVEEEPETFGRSVASLHRELGMKILGGCCGTDDRHIRCLARLLLRKAMAGADTICVRRQKTEDRSQNTGVGSQNKNGRLFILL
jgi:homocysteine S-methyltransferase